MTAGSTALTSVRILSLLINQISDEPSSWDLSWEASVLQFTSSSWDIYQNTVLTQRQLSALPKNSLPSTTPVGRNCLLELDLSPDRSGFILAGHAIATSSLGFSSPPVMGVLWIQTTRSLLPRPTDPVFWHSPTPQQSIASCWWRLDEWKCDSFIRGLGKGSWWCEWWLWFGCSVNEAGEWDKYRTQAD